MCPHACVRQDVPAPLPRLPKGVRPCLGGHSPRVPSLPAPVCDLPLSAPLRDTPRSHPFLRGRLWSDRILFVLPTECPDPTETLCQAAGQRGQVRRRFLSSQDGAHPLAHEQGQSPHLQNPGPPWWVDFYAQGRGQVGGLLVHPLVRHHHSLCQETSQGPSGLRCGQATFSPGDWPPSFPLPLISLLPPLPHPQLWRGRLCSHPPHDKEASHFLEQSSEMDDQLFRVYPHWYPGHRGLSPATPTPPRIQAPPSLPYDTMLPPWNQPCGHEASSLSADALPPPKLPRPQKPERRECGQSPAPPVAPAQTALKK